MIRKSILILLGILLLGFTLRAYRVAQLPLYGDELTMVYDSYSLLKTGKDQTGASFPLTFKMGAGRPAGYVYFSIPFVAVFGPGAWGVRGLSVLSGLGIIVLMYFLGKKLFNEKIALIGSFLTSISMWDIYLSRGGFEAHFALFLALLGITLFLYKKYLSMSIAWGLAISTYPTFKLTLPLMFLALLWFGGIKDTLKSKLFVVSILILAFFAGLAINETLKGISEERFLRLNIFSDSSLQQTIIQKINEERNLSSLPDVLKPVFYNKPLEYSRILLGNYMENISVNFLYLRGDRNPRHNPGEWGMLYLIEFPLLFIGLYHLGKNEKKKLILFISWILIVPVATMFLGQTHALRNDFMIPPLILISAYALSNLPKVFARLSLAIMLIQLVFILAAVYFLAPVKFANFWSTSAKAVSQKAIENRDKYKTIVLSTKIDNIEYAYPVYAKLNPNLVIAQYGKYPKIYDNVIITDNVKSIGTDKSTLIYEK
ncbi:MAG: glycosyltransferase family 39 protein [Patescibacteria group bacterium]